MSEELKERLFEAYTKAVGILEKERTPRKEGDAVQGFTVSAAAYPISIFLDDGTQAQIQVKIETDEREFI